MKILYNIKQYLFCSVFHKKYRCYPEVWKEKSGWHCKKCHPCSEAIEKLPETLEKMKNNPRFRKKMLKQMGKINKELNVEQRKI